MSQAGPDFIGAGFSRCGTTSLYAYFRAHPDMWMPPLKEITYWDLERHDGRRSAKRSARLRFAASHTWRNTSNRSQQRRDVAFLARYATGHPSDAWYRSLFAPAGDRCTGDLSPSYMRLPDEDVRELTRQLPNVKILFMLRDPLDRAWSNAKKALARGSDRVVSDVPDDEIEAFVTSTDFLMNCDYVTPLRRWRSIVPPEQLFVGFTTDLDRRPAEFLTDLGRFLDVDPAPLVRAQQELPREFTTEAYGGAIPHRWEKRLALHLQPMTVDLADDVGSHAVAWRDRVQRAATSTSTSGDG